MTGDSTVQYHEIVAWVNPEAWVDEDEAMRVVEAIFESGTDDEAEWVRIAGGSPDDVASAAARDFDRAATTGTEGAAG